MLALGDALALVTSRMRDFRREDFARFHPAGSLGRQLSKVDEFMRPPAECRLAPASQSVREVFVAHGRAGRRSGAIMLVDRSGKLAGLFTDSDLARLFEHKRDAALDRPIREVMTTHPARVEQGSMMLDAVAMMAERKISELPVIDRRGRPCGMIDITDVVALFPEAGLGPTAGWPADKAPRRKSAPPSAPSRKCA
jgi:arabinose-5-phosphate isomerase